MSRIEQIGDCTLYLGDCLDIMYSEKIGDISDEFAFVTDPPYGIGEAAGKNKTRGGLATPKDYGDADWDNQPADQRIIEYMLDHSESQIIFGGNYYVLPPTSCWLVWDKQNGTNDFADCELAWTNLKKAVRRIYWRWNGMIRRGDDKRVHPTQKPVGVMTWCIEHLPTLTDTICDPFMGSGTTGVSAVKMNKKFIGIERDKTYFDIACRRIEEAYRQPRLFDEPKTKPTQESLL